MVIVVIVPAVQQPRQILDNDLVEFSSLSHECIVYYPKMELHFTKGNEPESFYSQKVHLPLTPTPHKSKTEFCFGSKMDSVPP